MTITDNTETKVQTVKMTFTEYTNGGMSALNFRVNWYTDIIITDCPRELAEDLQKKGIATIIK